MIICHRCEYYAHPPFPCTLDLQFVYIYIAFCLSSCLKLSKPLWLINCIVWFSAPPEIPELCENQYIYKHTLDTTIFHCTKRSNKWKDEHSNTYTDSTGRLSHCIQIRWYLPNISDTLDVKKERELLWFFFLMLTISLFSSMDGAPLVPKRFRSMPLHASSSWYASITYMPPTSCSLFLSCAYYLMPNDLFPCLSLIIYTLFVPCPPCLFRIIYIHTPYTFYTLTMLSLVYKRL